MQPVPTIGLWYIGAIILYKNQENLIKEDKLTWTSVLYSLCR